MIDGRKVVACTPAGRRQYLEILLPYVLRDRHIIDEYQLWLNTEDEEDVAYIRHLAEAFPDFIKVVEPDPSIEIIPDKKGYSIHQFFRGCTEPGTVYVRLDDDILFVDKNAIETLVRFRIENPQYFLIYGNIINNAITSHLHQRFGVIDQQLGTAGYWCLDQIGWEDPKFAEHCHRWFFHHYQEGSHDKYKAFDKWELNVFERVSINVISWLGEEFLAFKGEVHYDEEFWLSQIKPQELGKMNCIVGGALFSHFAFYVQREYLDATNILSIYKHICDLETRDMADPEKLMYVLNILLSAPVEKLKEVEFLEHMIRQSGLYPDARNLYGNPDNSYMNKRSGAWQVPRQLAELMRYLQNFRISSYLDVGTFQGWTCSLLAAVLWRFNPDIKITAIDPESWWEMYPTVSSLLPIVYRQETTANHVGRKYDLVFIDGNHEYANVRQDYENVGKSANLCVFHDCNDDYIRACPYMGGGVPKLWGELKSGGASCREFFSHSDDRNVMGIGVIVNVNAQH